MQKLGFLRETTELAQKAGLDADTDLHRTGLDEYLSIIFPNINDWVHDKSTGLVQDDGKPKRTRPDYRSDALNLIVEFDGLPHYTDPAIIINDELNTKFYEKHGYTVVRIPYFIQLTNKAVQTFFGISIDTPLFDESIPSIGPKGQNTPAYLCYAGIQRMAAEFHRFPEQYAVNLAFLKSQPDIRLTRFDLLELEYNRIDD